MIEFMYKYLFFLIFSLFSLICYSSNSDRFTFYNNESFNSITNSPPRFKRYLNKRWDTENEKLLYLLFSVPNSNHFYIPKLSGKKESSFGFLGVTSGLEFFIKKNYYIEFKTGYLFNYKIPIPYPVFPKGKYERFNTFMFNLEGGNIIDRFNLGYGLQFSNTEYTYRHEKDSAGIQRDLVLYKNNLNALGFSMTFKYRVTEEFNIALNYFPSFWLKRNGRYSGYYTHMIYLDLIYKFKVWIL